MSTKNTAKTHYLHAISTQVITGVIFSFMLMLTCLTMSQLIYHDALRNYSGMGMGLILLGTLVGLLGYPLLSRIKHIIASPLVDPLGIYIVLATSLTIYFYQHHIQNGLFITLIVSMSLSTFATAILSFIIGLTKKAKFIRFLPYPVIAGFSASLGWLLFISSLKLIDDIPFSLSLISVHLQPFMIQKYILTFVFFIILYMIQRKHNAYHFISVITLGFVVFYVIYIGILGISLQDLAANHMLITKINPVRWSSYYQAFSNQTIQWPAIEHMTSTLLLIVFFSIIGPLIKLSTLDLALDTDVDINQEIKNAGLINFINGFIASIPSYISVSATTVNHEYCENHPSRLYITNIVTVLFCSLVFLKFIIVFSYVPTFIISAMILCFSCVYIKVGIYDSFKRMEWHEFIIVLIILGVVIKYGIFEGVAAGIIISITIFAITYSRLNIVREILTGESLFSTKQREPHVQTWLAEHGNYLTYIKIHNYIFFGNVQDLLETLKNRVKSNKDLIKFLILDFNNVVGIDSSAMVTFVKIRRLAEKFQFNIIFTNISPAIIKKMERNDIFNTRESAIRIIHSRDEAIRLCEDSYMQENKIIQRKSISLEERLKELHDNIDTTDILNYFEKKCLKEGEYLFRIHDTTDALYYVESGYLNILWEASLYQTKWLQAIGPGNTTGEYSFYFKKPRRASLVAAEDCVVYVHTYADRERLLRENKLLVIYIDELIIRNLIERVVHSWGR